jgi:hypothetical protein
MLPLRIEQFLNAGDSVAAEVASPENGTRCFVRIQAIPKPGIPREERRYLNSQWSMWEYWDFEFRRMVLRSGWETDEWNYDRYLIDDQKKTTYDDKAFASVLKQWVPNPDLFRHVTESEMSRMIAPKSAFLTHARQSALRVLQVAKTRTIALAAACMLIFTLGLGFADVVASADLPEHLGLPAITRWFDTIRANGVDVSKPLIFGYDFSSTNSADINDLRARMEVDGYSFVQTYVADEGRTKLEVERKEIHSPESLAERNRQLRSLAKEFRTVQYDGYAINLYPK